MLKFKPENVIGGVLVAGMLAFMFGGALVSLWGIPDAFAVTTSTPQTQTINLTVNQVITLTLSSSTLTLPSLTPGTAVSATASATVTTNADNGFNLYFNRVNNPTSTLTYGATSTFPDASNIWNQASPNATDTTRAAVTSTLSFRVMQTGTPAGIYSATYWGANDTDGVGAAMYAGFPTTTQIVASTSTYANTAQTITYKVRADAPTTQRAGAYTGQITITATALP